MTDDTKSKGLILRVKFNWRFAKEILKVSQLSFYKRSSELRAYFGAKFSCPSNCGDETSICIFRTIHHRSPRLYYHLVPCCLKCNLRKARPFRKWQKFSGVVLSLHRLFINYCLSLIPHISSVVRSPSARLWLLNLQYSNLAIVRAYIFWHDILWAKPETLRCGQWTDLICTRNDQFHVEILSCKICMIKSPEWIAVDIFCSS